MIKLILFRAASAVPTVFLVGVFSFLLLHISPGSPAAAILGPRPTPETVAQLEADMGLDDPLVQQFGRWIGGAARGDLGESAVSGRPVSELLWNRVPATLSIVVASTLFAVVLGIGAGIAAGVWRGSLVDRSLLVGISAGLAIPEFWLGIFLIELLAVKLAIFPVVSWTPPTRDLSDWAVGLVLPSLSLGLVGAAFIARQMRRSMIEALESSYVRMLRSIGTPERVIVLRYAAKNGIVPVMTVIGFFVVFLFGGSLVIERVFSIPGIGTLALQAVNERDLPLVQGLTLGVACVVIVVYLVIDVLTGLVNPKVRPE